MSTVIEPAAGEVEPLKQIQRFIWGQGQYEEIASRHMDAAEAIVEALEVGPGMRLIDVAAGTGNVAVAAARRGAAVVASDITPKMVELGRARCVRERLDVEWHEADAEALPAGDGAFDCSASAFGAMFAPRPAALARELTRVVCPGGRVAMANWTPGSFVSRLAQAIMAYLPTPPVVVPPPAQWGAEEIATARLAPFSADVETRRLTVPMAHASVDDTLAFHERCNGPLIAARTLLRDRYTDLAADVRRVIEECNSATDGSVLIQAEYLLVLARTAA